MGKEGKIIHAYDVELVMLVGKCIFIPPGMGVLSLHQPSANPQVRLAYTIQDPH